MKEARHRLRDLYSYASFHERRVAEIEISTMSFMMTLENRLSEMLLYIPSNTKCKNSNYKSCVNVEIFMCFNFPAMLPVVHRQASLGWWYLCPFIRRRPRILGCWWAVHGGMLSAQISSPQGQLLWSSLLVSCIMFSQYSQSTNSNHYRDRFISHLILVVGM